MSRIGTIRRLQALAAIGWTQTQIAAELGTTRQHVCKAMSGHVEIGRHAGPRYNATGEILRGEALVHDVFESLRDGPARRHQMCGWLAKVNGWYPPTAWDETDIDEPTARPWDSLAVSYWAALPILHGEALVAHVVRRMGWASSSAARIAETAGYGSVERCAAVLARCRRADLGRALLARQSMAETRASMAAA